MILAKKCCFAPWIKILIIKVVDYLRKSVTLIFKWLKLSNYLRFFHFYSLNVHATKDGQVFSYNSATTGEKNLGPFLERNSYGDFSPDPYTDNSILC